MRNIEPGKIIKIFSYTELIVKCGEDALKIIDYEPKNES